MKAHSAFILPDEANVRSSCTMSRQIMLEGSGTTICVCVWKERKAEKKEREKREILIRSEN